MVDMITRAIGITALTVGCWLWLVRLGPELGPQIAGTPPADAAEGCEVSYVYDGDTVALDCGEGAEITARLVGFDTPETKEPGCAEELAHGALVSDRLRALIGQGAVAYEIAGRDKYDRLLITLRVAGEDVGERLIREGLAVPYRGGARIDWCDRLGAG
ncbi:thermonuclease family protein [Roseovarius sp. C7]|uniref:thermonuclease family protein n=1 Tax=Roseovarius sp. C7 TaxID=3398643 RepID=UPI0039F4A125